jgi:hypothetical protein
MLCDHVGMVSQAEYDRIQQQLQKEKSGNIAKEVRIKLLESQLDDWRERCRDAQTECMRYKQRFADEELHARRMRRARGLRWQRFWKRLRSKW